jgi:ABC-type oligopeptide transport system substrate-binding subunit
VRHVAVKAAGIVASKVQLLLVMPLYQQAEQILVDQTASCPLYQTKNRYLLRGWGKGGFAEDGRGLIPNDAWITGYIAPH